MATSGQCVTGTVQQPGTVQRLRMTIRGAVQGVGFRPFLYRLATELGLNGWVNNTASGVHLEVEGPRVTLEEFLLRVEREKPPISFIQSLESSFADPSGYTGFEIRHSSGGEKSALVMPDIATCPECLRELFDPNNRRFGYPFTNCTNCGPRYSIIESLPYDRPRTTMKRFRMCAACEHEYHDPNDRRFHAQPNACPECGPHLELWSMTGAVLARRSEALEAAATALRDGKIVGVKGLGGFHLMVDARNEDAVVRLRGRKHREEKPFALMFPSVEDVLRACEVEDLELRLLRSVEAPIVLLRRRNGSAEAGSPGIASSVAPGNPLLGVMLPYTPLHHLLMRALGFPVVATSGNLSDEPICTDEQEALARLAKIADLLLVHDRPILRHVDDSIVRIMAGREMVMRRARGFAPLPVMLDQELMAGDTPSLLALGAHQKNTVALSVARQVFLSQHIGDLESEPAYAAFAHVIESLQELYEAKPAKVACDLHPDYVSTGHALRMDPNAVRVQHHYAHALACMAENAVRAPALGVCWDGSGWGPDKTVWGGEFLHIDECGYRRVARLRPFRLAGSERAVREPRRCGLSLLCEALGAEAFAREELSPVGAFTPAELRILAAMLKQDLNSPWTSSAGRLFDGVASLLGVRQVSRYEGQAAMELEWLAESSAESGAYEFRMVAPTMDGAPMEMDWGPMVLAMLTERARQESTASMARRFHNTLAEMIAGVVRELARQVGELPVLLSGGCFQNRLLTELTVRRLQADGVRVYWHQRVPPNDGGIALGQLMAAARELRLEEERKGQPCV